MSSEEKFTAGDWQVGDDDPTGEVAVIEAVDGQGRVTREICHAFTDRTDEEQLAEDLANLRLMAAAPKLFRAAAVLVPTPISGLSDEDPVTLHVTARELRELRAAVVLARKGRP